MVKAAAGSRTWSRSRQDSTYIFRSFFLLLLLLLLRTAAASCLRLVFVALAFRFFFYFFLVFRMVFRPGPRLSDRYSLLSLFVWCVVLSSTLSCFSVFLNF